MLVVPRFYSHLKWLNHRGKGMWELRMWRGEIPGDFSCADTHVTGVCHIHMIFPGDSVGELIQLRNKATWGNMW